MYYQLPPPTDDGEFEMLVRDIARRVYDDPGVERFGRSGQAQHGIDGFSPADPGITFQCKLKDVRHKSDEQQRDVLLTEMEEEFGKTKGLAARPERFIFATTFKNDTKLQEKATALSDDSTTLEYWGWDTINEKIWDYAEVLIHRYYPSCPVRQVPGFRQINRGVITKAQTDDAEDLKKLATEYYRINDRSEVVFRVVCNDLDVRNDRVMGQAFDRLGELPAGGTLWILGNGGSGKTTILHRLALELARDGRNVYMLNLETHLGKYDLETIFSWVKYCSTSEKVVLCIDNPAADEEALEVLLRRLPDYTAEIHILLAERTHRYKALQRAGNLTHIHGEEDLAPIYVRNSSQQRLKVYDRFFELLELSEDDKASLRGLVLNEQIVYVNTTYSMLLELKRKRKIDFDFDWDDYRKTTADLIAFLEGYKYIALFYLFGVRAPFTVLSKVYGADEAQQGLFLERFRGLVNEPIIVDERRDDSFRNIIHVRTKHEIVSEIFFREHPELNKDELLMGWCEKTDFGDAIETQALINILGVKKNYSGENPYVDFSILIDFLLRGHLHENVSLSSKLTAVLHLAKFWLLLFQDKSEEAIALLEAFLERAPEDLHSRTELAKVYLKRGKLAEAEAALLTILNLEPHDLNSRTELARVYQRQNKLSAAESVLLRLLELDEHNIQARTELAKVQQRQGRLDEAEDLLLRVLEIKPYDLNSRTELAKIYLRQGRLAEAEAALLRILDIKPRDLNSRTELAKVYQRQNKLIEAEAVLLKSLEIDLDQLHPRTELAKIYQRQGRLGEAEAVLLKLLELDANNLQARTELAKIYQRQGRLGEAIRRLEEYINLDPKGLHPRTELAKIYQRQGRLVEAIRRLEEEIELDPKGLHPRTELAKIYQRQGRLVEAEKRAEEVLTIDPLNDHAISELLAIWESQDEKDKCAKRFMGFITQPKYRFSRYSQAPVFRFFRCCRAFGMKEHADAVFDLFQSELDEKNLRFYMSNFR